MDKAPPNTTTRGRTLDHAAWLYDVVQPVVTLGRDRAYNQRFVGELSLSGHERVLDIGCGTGLLTAAIGTRLDAEAGGASVGIDAAPKMIAVAIRKRASDTARFEVEAAEALPFGDETFDHAVSSFFFHHVDYELKVRAVREARRVRRPGGLFLVLDVDTPTTWFGRFCVRAAEWLFRQPEITENKQGLLRAAFTAGGFVDWKAIGHWQGYVTLFSMVKPGSQPGHSPKCVVQ